MKNFWKIINRDNIMRIIPATVNIVFSDILFTYLDAIIAPTIAPAEVRINSCQGNAVFMKCPIPPAREMNAMIITEVPTALLIEYPRTNVSVITIAIPPPIPRTPETKPTIEPIRIIESLFLSSKNFTSFVP